MADAKNEIHIDKMACADKKGCCGYAAALCVQGNILFSRSSIQ